MKSVQVTIEGISPLLMHAFPLSPIEAIEKKTPAEQAEFALYREPNGAVFVPGIAVQRALIGGSTYSKGKGRGSLAKVVAACVLVSPEHILLEDVQWVVDSRPVVVPATKGRILRHRPRFDSWKLSFRVDYDENLIMRDQLNKIIVDTGSRVGLLDFRPEKRGPFGRFQLVEFK